MKYAGLEEYKKKLSSSLIRHLDENVQSGDQLITVLVRREDDIDAETTSSLEQDIELSGAKVIDRIEFINTDVVHITPEKLSEIVKNPGVKSVSIERNYYALMDIAKKVVSEPLQLGTNLDGSGVTIAILDTGIHPHRDLIEPNNRIIGFFDAFSGQETAPFDDNGHGTHCAGCAAGNGVSSNNKFRGPAHKANIVGVRVLKNIPDPTDPRAGGPNTVILKGIEWCIRNKQRFGIKVMSLSLGVEAVQSAENDELCRGLKQATLAGITVVVAAGNSGRSGSQTIESPGIEPSVITVGATDDHNTVGKTDDNIAVFSSKGPTIDGETKPDIVAPGNNIISLRSPGSRIDSILHEDRIDENYFSSSGTSMATPIVAGIVALLYQKSPRSKPKEIKEALREGAIDMFHHPNDAGKGYVNVQGAIDKLPRT